MRGEDEREWKELLGRAHGVVKVREKEFYIIHIVLNLASKCRLTLVNIFQTTFHSIHPSNNIYSNINRSDPRRKSNAIARAS